jgi:hypothetical protein
VSPSQLFHPASLDPVGLAVNVWLWCLVLAFAVWIARQIHGRIRVAIAGANGRFVRRRRPPAPVLAPAETTRPAPEPIASAPAVHSPEATAVWERWTDDEVLCTLAHELAQHRYRQREDDATARILETLDPREWLIERYVPVAGRVAPFLVLGSSGAFVVWPVGDPWSLSAVEVLSTITDGFNRRFFPQYGGQVRGILCLPGSELPAQWFDQEGREAWATGRGQLIALLRHFSDPGFSAGDIAWLQGEARQRRRTTTETRPVPQIYRARPQG